MYIRPVTLCFDTRKEAAVAAGRCGETEFIVRAYVNTVLKDNSNPKSIHHFFYVLLTVPLSITLANDQLDAQLFYFIIRLLQSSTCFEQRRAHHQEVKFY